jgi:hypothetical protein
MGDYVLRRVGGDKYYLYHLSGGWAVFWGRKEAARRFSDLQIAKRVAEALSRKTDVNDQVVVETLDGRLIGDPVEAVPDGEDGFVLPKGMELPEGHVIPERPEIVPDWDRYRGNHHNSIPDPKQMFGGSVSFARHLGMPLTRDLWEDIVFRLRAFNLRVYSAGQEQWTDTWADCVIHLNGDGYIDDISYKPRCPWPIKWFSHSIGESVANVEALRKVDFT